MDQISISISLCLRRSGAIGFGPVVPFVLNRGAGRDTVAGPIGFMTLQGAQSLTAMELIDAANSTRLKLPIVLAVACGFRRGEILALQWESVDWLANTIAVRLSVEETKAGIRFNKPKVSARPQNDSCSLVWRS